MWSGERLSKVQTTPGPDHVLPEAWTKIGKLLRREKNKNGQMRTQDSIMLDE